MSKGGPIPYKRFRTGYTYREIAEMMWSYSDDPKTWLPASEKTTVGPDGKKKWKRRRLILGKWHEIKTEMYEQYLHDFNQADPAEAEPFDQGEKFDQLADAVPF